MKLDVLFLALTALTLSACVNSSNLCPTGFEYESQYDACFAVDAGGAASASANDAATTSVADAGPSEGGDASATARSTGLGTTCNADSDCTGTASYCLKDPSAPSSAGFCTLTHCTAGTCTSAYGCCDCSSSSVSELQAYPPGFCAPTSDVSELTAFGCACQ